MDEKFQELRKNLDQVSEKQILEWIEAYFHGQTTFLDTYSINDIMEVYLMREHFGIDAVRVATIPIHELYRVLGDRTTSYKKKDFYYGQALKWNPVDIDSRFSLSTYLARRGKLPELKIQLDQLQKLLYTRADLGRIYRFYGFYFLETYQPELSVAAYRLSNHYDRSQEALDNLDYLNKVVPKVEENLDIQLTMSLLEQHGVVTRPAKYNLLLLNQMALEHAQKGEMERGKIYHELLSHLLGTKE